MWKQNCPMNLKKNKPSPNYRSTISNSYLQKIVEEISFPRVYGTPENDKARNLIINYFKDHFEDNLIKVEGKMKNVVVGDVNTAKIIVGAHYDSVPNTPGADDNASAVAVMLGIASQVKNPIEQKVCFVSFNCEEFGLKGAKEFASTIPKSNNIEQVHVLEMVGYKTDAPDSQINPLAGIPMLGIPTVGNFIGTVSNNSSLTKKINQAANESDILHIGLHLPWFASIAMVDKIAPQLLRSDHAPFWVYGYKAAMWTDTAEFRNKNYHQPTDTPDTLDYDFMASVGQIILNLINKSNKA